MHKLIPNIKVNYKFIDILKASFISSRNDKYINKLNKFLSGMFHVKQVVLTSSGRSALFHILSYLPQKKVYIPAYTCEVVAEAVILAGKEIVYVHVDRNTLDFNNIPELDSDSIFIATHQYGFPCKIAEICEICKNTGAVLIEDCAGALGSLISGKLAGTFGDYAFFSFNASKLINSPSCGGFLIAKSDNDIEALIEKIKFKPCQLSFKVKNLCKSIALCADKNAYFHYWMAKVTRHDADRALICADKYQPNPLIVDDYYWGLYNWQAFVLLKQLRKLHYYLSKRKELIDIYNNKLQYFFKSDCFERQKSCIRYPIYLKDREKIRKRLMNFGVSVGFGFEHYVCPSDYYDELDIANEITYLPFSSNYSRKEINLILFVLNTCATNN